jgi:hypothetical protein
VRAAKAQALISGRDYVAPRRRAGHPAADRGPPLVPVGDAGRGAVEQVTLADVVLGLSVQRWLATPIVHAPLPALRAYHARLAARPAWAAAGCADHP